MSYVIVTPMKDEEWFKRTKAAVFRGEIEPDGFDTEDYKYFDKIRELGYKYRAGQINKEQFNAADQKYYKEYEQFKESYLEHIANVARMCHNIKRTEALRTALNNADSKDRAFEFALEIAELCTGETGMKDRIFGRYADEDRTGHENTDTGC